MPLAAGLRREADLLDCGVDRLAGHRVHQPGGAGNRHGNVDQHEHADRDHCAEVLRAAGELGHVRREDHHQHKLDRQQHAGYGIFGRAQRAHFGGELGDDREVERRNSEQPGDVHHRGQRKDRRHCQRLDRAPAHLRKPDRGEAEQEDRGFHRLAGKRPRDDHQQVRQHEPPQHPLHGKHARNAALFTCHAWNSRLRATGYRLALHG